MLMICIFNGDAVLSRSVFFCYYQKCKLRVIEFSAVHEKSETRKLYVDAMLIYR